MPFLGGVHVLYESVSEEGVRRRAGFATTVAHFTRPYSIFTLIFKTHSRTQVRRNTLKLRNPPPNSKTKDVDKDYSVEVMF